MIRDMFVRLWLLQKRLLKRKSFFLLLCLAPLLAAGVGRLSEEPAGIAVIALYLPQKNTAAQENAAVEEIAHRIFDGESVLRYLSCGDEKEARAYVESGEADAAWIFAEDMEERLRELADRRRVRPVVTVLERSDSVPLILSREILTAAIYPAFSYAVYEGYVREELGMEEMTEEELRAAYERVAVEGSLFRMVYPDRTLGEAEDYGYVQAPLRGILAIWLIFCGLASALWFMRDEEKGVYERIPAAKRLLASYTACAVFLADASVVMLSAVKLSGVFTNWKSEVAGCVVFAACVTAFANFLRLLCRTPQRLGMTLLPLAALMLALCPVFLNLQRFRAGKMLLPPWYYLQSIHDTRYLYLAAVYTAALILLSLLLQRFKRGTV